MKHYFHKIVILKMSSQLKQGGRYHLLMSENILQLSKVINFNILINMLVDGNTLDLVLNYY